MSVVPQGKAVQAMYRDFREGNLLVNRKYQRKLVWTIDEKRKLIDSILKGYPIPLILLAEHPDSSEPGRWEIIDGIQRLNAIFSFIENAFDLDNGSYFDIHQFATARQYSEEGVFKPYKSDDLLPPKECSKILDYQLAVTIYPIREESKITDVFGRINSGGKQLSAHEQRQAGVTSQFSYIVRSLASELRGDVSKDILLLSQMPEISIDSDRTPHGYSIKAEDTFWCRQGILSIKQLKESEDEQLIADIAASIVLNAPLAASKEKFDELYDTSKSESNELERRTVAYNEERLSKEIKYTFSILKNVIEECDKQPNYLRSVVRPGIKGQYPIKAAFYAIFMAFFELIVKEIKSPCNSFNIINALKSLSTRLKTGAHYETTENRLTNINLTKGLIQRYFAERVPPVFGHGPALSLDFENALRRSRIESSRYEFKQGILRLDATNRKMDEDLLQRIVNTACGISNLGPDSGGNIFIGVADKKADADKIASLDGINSKEIGDHYVVGIEREAKILSIDVDRYVQKIIGFFQSSKLSEPLKTQVLSGFDTITLDGLTVIRIVIPKQKDISFVGDKAFSRNGSSTIEINGKQLVAVSKHFSK